MLNKISEFFQDQDQALSMTRLCIFILTLAYIGQASYITYTTKVIPDIPMGLAALMGSLYMMNQELIKLHIGTFFGAKKTTETPEGAK